MPVMAAVGDNRRMAIRVTDKQARARFSALLDAVSAGETIEITRDGRLVARIVHVTSPLALRGALAGKAATSGPDDELFTTGSAWLSG
jgi:prevent-host-death family protein